MKEEIAKTKECRAPGVALSDTKGGWLWPMCSGSSCLMWEPEYEEITKEWDESCIIPDGWHYKSKGVIAGYVKADSGDCGLKTKECEGGCRL